MSVVARGPGAVLLLGLMLADVAAAGDATTLQSWWARSPDGRQEAIVELAEGRLTYRLERRDGDAVKPVLAASPLGLNTDAGRFSEELKVVSATEPKVVEQNYTMWTGKQLQLRDRHTAMAVTVENAKNARMTVEFRVYDDGLAFRYGLRELPKKEVRVVGEATGFKFASGGKVWMQPYSQIATWSPAYEEYFTNGAPLGEPAPWREGWALPGLFETDGGWVLLTEADLDGRYAGSHLDATVKDRTYTLRFDLAETANGIGVAEPTIGLPWAGPWRVVISGISPGAVLESNLGHHVSRAPAKRDWSWVKPGRATWSWWSDHSSPRDFNKITPFIDLAAKWGWEYSLVDANWNVMANGDIEKLVAYAKGKNVGLLLWYNSGGEHTDITEQPRHRLIERESRRAEFARLQKLGVKGVKVDFFQSDKQWMIQHYLGILEDAAEFQLLVNFHGCTIPRGWQRTYPNLMTMEAVRGAEIYSCCEDYGPAAIWQNTVLPFTRNVIGSMDYTPVTFTDQKIPHQTTFAHELALSVVFESGIQHFADAVRGYEQLPDYAQEWMKSVPTVWDETRYVAGYPGKLAVVARRKGDVWRIAGIEGEDKAKTVTVELPFLEAGSYSVEVIADGNDDRSFSRTVKTIKGGEPFEVSLRAAGGFVAKVTRE